jgi:hypothetical protein
VVPLVGCSETGGDANVIEAIEEMMVGRWWLDWDKSAANTADGIGLATFTHVRRRGV